MNNTLYLSNSIHCIKSVCSSAVSGYGTGHGMGFGCGFGMYIVESWAGTISCITRSDVVLSFLSYGTHVNYNGCGSGRQGCGRGHGACHNNAYIITDNGKRSWCYKLKPPEIDIEEAHE